MRREGQAGRAEEARGLAALVWTLPLQRGGMHARALPHLHVHACIVRRHFRLHECVDVNGHGRMRACPRRCDVRCAMLVSDVHVHSHVRVRLCRCRCRCRRCRLCSPLSTHRVCVHIATFAFARNCSCNCNCNCNCNATQRNRSFHDVNRVPARDASPLRTRRARPRRTAHTPRRATSTLRANLRGDGRGRRREPVDPRPTRVHHRIRLRRGELPRRLADLRLLREDAHAAARQILEEPRAMHVERRVARTVAPTVPCDPRRPAEGGGSYSPPPRRRSRTS